MESRLAISAEGELVSVRTKPLIVATDDEPLLLEALSDLFSKFGCEVITYQYKDDCFNELPLTLPDVILTDIRAPRVDGFEFLGEIKSHPKFKSIPVIILSGFLNEENTIEAKRLGAFACVPKPFRPLDVVKPVLDALDLM